MKKWLFLALVPFLFSGCAVSGKYNEGYISNSIEHNYNKVGKIPFNFIKNNNNIMSRSHDNLFLRELFVEMEVGNINNMIAESYYQQYFHNFKYVDNCKEGICVSVFIKNYDFKYKAPADGSTVNIYISSKIFIDGVLKSDKEYKIFGDNEVLLGLVGFSSPVNGFKELFHKTLFNFYENEFKQDLLNAL